MIAAIIAAAGSGERFGAAIPKALIQLGDRTLIEHAVSSISSVADQIIVTAPAGYEKQIQSLVGDGITVVTGGATRSESVRIGLSKVLCDAEYVLIHDAARALEILTGDHRGSQNAASCGSGGCGGGASGSVSSFRPHTLVAQGLIH